MFGDNRLQDKNYNGYLKRKAPNHLLGKTKALENVVFSRVFDGSPVEAIFEIERIPEASSSAKVIVFVPLL